MNNKDNVLQPSFIKGLFESQEPIVSTKVYPCANCHRPVVPAAFIAVISHGEAYCKYCVKETV